MTKRTMRKSLFRKTKRRSMRGGSACSSVKSNNMTGGSACSSVKSNMTGGSACSSVKSNNMTGGSACSSVKSNMTGGSACSSVKSNNMTGGSACSSVKSNMTGGSACSSVKSNNMTGGSLASSYVENYANSRAQNQPLNEYTTQMDLPSMQNIKGGGSGCCGSMLKGGKKSKRRAGWQKGGSAYNRVMSNLAEVKGSGMTGEMPAPVGDVKNMPRLYQLTGGRKRHSSKTKKRAGQRGGSFWNFAGYGNINAGPAMFKNDHYFTKDTSHPSWKDLMDPPTKEKAGSGDKQDLAVGASYPFN